MKKKRESARKLFEDKQLPQVKSCSKRISAFALTAFSVLSCVLAVIGVIWVKANFSDVDAIKAFVERNYLLSAIAMIIISAAQVVIALVPGELIEIAAGYAFGAFFGTIIALIGITLGSVLVLLLARRLGRRFVEAFYPREKIDSLPLVNDKKRRNALVFLLFLIPGTPKDLITYAVGITDMSIPLYLLLATFARIPSILTSTIGGNALGNNKLLFALGAFIVSGAISLSGYLVFSYMSKKHKNDKQKNEVMREKNDI